MTPHFNEKHGATKGRIATPLYICWQAMKRRCYNPQWHGYRFYGGRGIRICESWVDFSNFAADMEATYFPGATLDRIDPDGHYCPENCRWLTASENSARRRGVWSEEFISRLWQEYQAGTTQSALAKKYSLGQGALSNAFKRWRSRQNV